MTAVNTFLQVDLADVDGFTREFLEELQFGQGVTLARATTNDLYMALARTVRQQLMSRWLDTVSTQMRAQAKVVAYLSAEYLLGRQLDNALLAADLTETAERSMRSLGLDLDRLRDAEVEPGLGNGGLGRGPFLGELPGLAEHDRHAGPAHLQLGQPVGHHRRSDAVELEDLRVAAPRRLRRPGAARPTRRGRTAACRSPGWTPDWAATCVLLRRPAGRQR